MTLSQFLLSIFCHLIIVQGLKVLMWGLIVKVYICVGYGWSDGILWTVAIS